MVVRRSAGIASCGLLLVLCVAACTREFQGVPSGGSTERTAEAADPADPARAAGSVVGATVVVEGSYGSDLTFCRQRGPVSIQLTQRGDVVRGDFSGAAPVAASDEQACDEQPEMTGYWEIDVSDTERQDVLACVVNGSAADTAILFRSDSGIEIECTSAGASSDMLLETTFFVDT